MTDADQIQSELEQAVAARDEHAQLTRRLEASAPHLADLEKHVADTRLVLDDETADVERLESFSAAKIWAHLKGSHVTDVERETAEREAARCAVAEAESRRDAMLRDRAALESRIAGLGDVEGRYRRAVADKEAWVTAHGGEPAAALAEVAERRGRLLALDNEAREALHRADLALTSFSQELADVDLPQVVGVQVDQLMRAFDVFFDNFFSDMAVCSRIQDASRRVEHATHQVQQALAALDEKGRDIARELDELDARREQLLLG